MQIVTNKFINHRLLLPPTIFLFSLFLSHCPLAPPFFHRRSSSTTRLQAHPILFFLATLSDVLSYFTEPTCFTAISRMHLAVAVSKMGPMSRLMSDLKTRCPSLLLTDCPRLSDLLTLDVSARPSLTVYPQFSLHPNLQGFPSAAMSFYFRRFGTHHTIASQFQAVFEETRRAGPYTR
ncbi:hypothetical protein C8J57DRAFT_1720673 [Mycena rebaudengoi]|nr:hypothetical protein C8J57DRAFT_1720673 [Mycena rebaudengoi]